MRHWGIGIRVKGWSCTRTDTQIVIHCGKSELLSYSLCIGMLRSFVLHLVFVFEKRKPASFATTLLLVCGYASVQPRPISLLHTPTHAITPRKDRFTDACDRSGTASAMEAGDSFEYKYYQTGTDGETVVYEGGANRCFTVPEGCARNVVQVDTWQE